MEDGLTIQSGEENKFNLFLFEPSNFFRKIQAENLRKAILIFLIVGLVSVVSGYIVNFVSMLLMPRMFGGYFSLSYGIVGLVFLLLEFVLFFIFGGAIHFMAKVGFKGTASYKDTMKVLFYSSLPMIIFNFSSLGILFIIYMFILATVGLAAIHGINKKKAFFSEIVPLFLIMVIITFIITGLFI